MTAAARIICAPEPAEVPAAGSVSLLELGERQCRWPYGERAFLFCGRERAASSSYCAGHHALSYTAPPTAEERRIARELYVRRSGADAR